MKLLADSLWVLRPQSEVFAEVALNAANLYDLHNRYYVAAESRAYHERPIRVVNFYEQKESRFFGVYSTMVSSWHQMVLQSQD